jgi:hypothetical protein
VEQKKVSVQPLPGCQVKKVQQLPGRQYDNENRMQLFVLAEGVETIVHPGD